MRKNVLMGVCLGIVLLVPGLALADCHDLGGFTSFSVTGSSTVTLFAGSTAVGSFDVQSCDVQSQSTIRLINSQVCDGDEVMIDGSRCTVLNIQSLN
jgi:hypothetical protein